MPEPNKLWAVDGLDAADSLRDRLADDRTMEPVLKLE
jgi:hypothetical protein